MKINPQAANIAQQNYSKNSATANNDKAQENKESINEAITLSINSSTEVLNPKDANAIKDRIQEISNKLQIDFAKESENFSKANINFFEGSFLTAQSTNINQKASELL